MKIILTTLTAISLFATTGCLFEGHRDHADDRSRPEHHQESAAGVDHGEHPGDMQHGETMQK